MFPEKDIKQFQDLRYLILHTKLIMDGFERFHCESGIGTESITNR